jgi:hypothetical protein
VATLALKISAVSSFGRIALRTYYRALMLTRESGMELQLLRATPESWRRDKGIRLRNLPTAFGLAKVIAKRRGSRATIELGLTGPSPERVTARCPGARRALAGGAPCAIAGNIVSARVRAHDDRILKLFTTKEPRARNPSGARQRPVPRRAKQ